MSRKYRVCVVGVVRNEKGEYLLIKKPDGLGVYPGSWGLPGGGMEKEETMEEGLRREMLEEVGLEIKQIEPLYFRDDVQRKYYHDGTDEEIYMIYLVFNCRAKKGEVMLNNEAETYAWVSKNKISNYAINEATEETFEKLGMIA